MISRVTQGEDPYFLFFFIFLKNGGFGVLFFSFLGFPFPAKTQTLQIARSFQMERSVDNFDAMKNSYSICI